MGYKLYKYDKFVNRELSTIESEESWATDGYSPYVEYTSTWGGTATIVYEFTDSNISNIEDDFILFAGGRLINYAGALDLEGTYGWFDGYHTYGNDNYISIPDSFEVLYKVPQYDDRLVDRDTVLTIWSSQDRYRGIQGIYYLMNIKFINNVMTDNSKYNVYIQIRQTCNED